MAPARRSDGRSWCSASSGTSGAPASSPALSSAAAVRCGRHRCTAHPAAAASAITIGNGTANTASAANAATARPTSSRPGQRAGADPPHRLRHDRHHCGRDAGEDRGDGGGVTERDVHRRQRQQRDHARQHEQRAGHQPAAQAVEQPTDVDRELLRLRAGQQHAVVQRVQEPALPDPAALPAREQLAELLEQLAPVASEIGCSAELETVERLGRATAARRASARSPSTAARGLSTGGWPTSTCRRSNRRLVREVGARTRFHVPRSEYGGARVGTPIAGMKPAPLELPTARGHTTAALLARPAAARAASPAADPGPARGRRPARRRGPPARAVPALLRRAPT